MRIARRIEALPPYLFAALDEKLAAKRAEGVEVISLGVGDPDQPTPEHIVAAMQDAIRDPATHRYPSYYGTIEYRTAVADWYGRRFGVELDPATEVISLIGSKEGVAHLAFAFVDPGDEALVSDPGYPVYATSTQLAGGTPTSLPLVAEHGFLPDLEAVPVSGRTKLCWINFPGNPTGAVADLGFFQRAVAWARDHDVLLAHDAAYSEITFDGFVAPSLLQVPGAKDVAIEFNSLSKFNNMTGWRAGFAVGSARAISALGVVKTNIDSGLFTAIQRAGVAALSGPQEHVEGLRATYQRRRDMVISALNGLGWSLKPPLGSIYVWLPVPEGQTSVGFADLLLDRAGVFVAPGSGYGPHGEGYVRIALTVSEDRLAEAMERLGEALG
ncbi:MAG TPA: LL-diaminopimelate aminotransferase [Actinomycetota bacterium]|jgi:LL-diaminopimelate aminotransferase|nr:LL-diaminopimelate aminotransferase [Actinomycetota bacterium]